ncbi:hypothetical protein H0A66_13325 [Alcaligenaceae bacterium]|nr:hypothetical protein [Alcaligenaceae bacterium]
MQLFPLETADSGSPDSIGVLAASSIRLKRYDACLLPITEHNLPWARTTLATAQGILHTPVLGLVRNLKAAALNDLCALGVADFIRDPPCPEELRVRIERLLADRRYHMASLISNTGISESARPYACQPPVAITQEALCATILDRSGHELEAFAVASASRCATSAESFRAAKSKVIERFERAYITAALGRHSGNIAMAARAAQKHRRAFWALMRKHGIDAAPFRCDSTPNRTIDR